MPLDDYRRANRRNWEDRVPIHLASRLYNIAAIKEDPDYLSPMVQFDRGLIGDVRDKSLLHLQCHIGQDTLSWARIGASVTGVDFSPSAISAARELAAEIGQQARFLEAELYDSPRVVQGQFDIVYTGMGALIWLPDMRGWAEVVSHFLKPGGTFLITEIHPVLLTLDRYRDDGLVSMVNSYFESGAPLRWDEERTYSDGDATVEHATSYEWTHSLGETVTALVQAGLRIELLREYPFVYGWEPMPGMEADEHGMTYLPGRNTNVPLMFTIRATKPV